MKHGIRWQFTLVLMGILIILIGGTVVVNRLFLKDSYMNYRQDLMEQTYDLLNAYVTDESRREEIAREISRYQEDHGISILIEKGGEVVFSNMKVDSLFLSRLQEHMGILVLEEPEAAVDPDRVFDREGKALQNEILRKTEHYEVSLSYDPVSEANYLECYGKLKDDYHFLMSSSYESSAESAEVSNRFFLKVGAVVLVIGALVLFVLIGRLLKPLSDLTALAGRMAHLDFTEKYNGKDPNEIGELGHAFNVLSDRLEQTISELKTANLQLKNELEERVLQDEARQDFISGVSHDLKTPIAIIQGYAEGLKDNVCETAEDRAFYCEVILDEAVKMNTLVKKLTMLNQIESGGEKPQIAYFDLTELVERSLHSYLVPCQDRQIRLDFEEKACPVWADAGMISEAFGNYLSNAFHYIPDGGKIRVFYEEAEEARVRLCVYNSGPGIRPETGEKIWDKFYREDRARMRDHGGNGIGLSIVKAILDKHNQKVGYRNEEEGVTFYMELDRAKE